LREVERQHPQQPHETFQVAQRAQQRAAERQVQRPPAGLGGTLAVLGEMRDPLQDRALRWQQVHLRRPLVAPVVPQHLRANVVELPRLAQVPGMLGGWRQALRQVTHQPRPRELRGCPLAEQAHGEALRRWRLFEAGRGVGHGWGGGGSS
jgi:hypothetical protein